MQIRILNKSGTNHEVSVTLLKNTPRGTARRKNVQSRTKIFNNVLSAVKTNSWLLSDETETRPERSTFTRSLRARACVRRRVHCWPFIVSSTLFISHAFTIRYYVLYTVQYYNIETVMIWLSRTNSLSAAWSKQHFPRYFYMYCTIN